MRPLWQMRVSFVSGAEFPHNGDMQTGFVQFAPALADLPATLTRLEAAWPVGGEADLLVLPELCNSGYALGDITRARSIAEPVADSKFLRYVQERCQRDDLHVVTGFAERDGDALYNSAVLVGPDGVEGVYRKLHLFMDECDLFSPGDLGLPIFEVRGTKLGMQVCFDWAFPEAWRALALGGAELVAHPCNLVIPGKAQLAARAHAMSNRIYVVSANRIGSEGDLHFTGRSQVVGLEGELLSSAEDEAPCFRLARIEPEAAQMKRITSRNDLLADRRTDVY